MRKSGPLGKTADAFALIKPPSLLDREARCSRDGPGDSDTGGGDVHVAVCERRTEKNPSSGETGRGPWCMRTLRVEKYKLDCSGTSFICAHSAACTEMAFQLIRTETLFSIAYRCDALGCH